MKRLLLALSERLRVDLLDLHDAIQADDVDAAVAKLDEIRDRIATAVVELRA